MNSLAQRITMLEATAHGPDIFNDLVNVIVSPGNSNPDINLVRDQHGGEWLRQPGETAQELKVRAIAVTLQHSRRVSIADMLTGCEFRYRFWPPRRCPITTGSYSVNRGLRLRLEKHRPPNRAR